MRGAPRLSRELLHRPRLSNLLAAGAAVTVVRAPIGFGKTTAVVHWLDDTEPRADVIWIAAATTPAETFWRVLDTELAFVLNPAAAHHTLGEAEARMDFDTRIARLSRRLLLVVDGFDAIASRELEDALSRLALTNPLVDLVVTVRSVAWFPDELRLSNDVSVVLPQDLLFTAAETAQLFARGGATRQDRDRLAEAVRAITGGWPGMVREVAAELGSSANTSHTASEQRRLSEGAARSYLYRELLALADHGVDPEWVDFGYAIAVPDSVSDQLATELSGMPDAADRLSRMERAGLLIRRSTAGRILYSWPAAARVALREQLREREPARYAVLNARTARWLHSRGVDAAALEHAVSAESLGLVREIVNVSWPELLYEHGDTMTQALRAIPLEEVVASPTAVALRDVLARQWSDTDELLQRVAQASLLRDRRVAAQLAVAERPAAFGHAIALMIALRRRGDFVGAISFASTAEVLAGMIGAGGQERPAVPQHYLTRAALQTGVTLALGGRPLEAITALTQAMRQPDPRPGAPAHAAAAAALALVSAIRGDTAVVERWLYRSGTGPVAIWPEGVVDHLRALARTLVAIDRVDHGAARDSSSWLTREPIDEPALETVSCYVHAQFALLWGDRRRALAELRAGRERLRPFLGPNATLSPGIDALEAELLIGLGLGTEAEMLLRAAPRTPETLVPLARLELLSGRTADALRTAMTGLWSALSSHRTLAELYLVCAIAQNRLDDRTAALSYLGFAVASGRNAEARRPFATVPRDELLQLAAGSEFEEFVVASVTGLPEIHPRTIEVIALTERERLVLQRIAEGKNMQQMAAEFYLSYNTVKSHMRSLYQKLGVRSRQQALARAREHRLLDVLTPAAEEPSAEDDAARAAPVANEAQRRGS